MTKKEYMKPEMDVVMLQQHCQILAGSGEGLNDDLQGEEVTDGWSRELFVIDDFGLY